MSGNKQKLTGVVVAIAVAIIVGLASGRGGDGGQVASSDTVSPSEATVSSPDITVPSLSPTSEASASSDDAAPWQTCVDGSPETITTDELPDEAIEVVDLIATDGPFPYDQDGATFQNREGILPDHERGYYHEYTVPTPGESDRGARRIVSGDCGELWYTDDHYDSFELIEVDR